MYTRTYGNKNLKKRGTIWEIINNHGRIEAREKECFKGKDGFLFIKVESIDYDDDYDNGDRYEGFTTDTFCQNLDLSIDGISHTCFRHTDLDVLKRSWNEQVSNLTISNQLTVYLCETTLNSFSELLNLIQSTVTEEFDTIYLKTKYDTITISFDVNDKNFYEMEFFVDEDSIENFSNYVDDYDWDEGIYGTISIQKLDRYIREFGGIDLTRTYVSSTKMKSEEEIKETLLKTNSNLSETEFDFLVLDAFFSGEMNEETPYYLLPIFEDDGDDYLYELIDNNIYAYRIINEDDKYWYTSSNNQFEKNDPQNILQFDPTDFSNIYGRTIDEVISIFNKNLQKFMI